MSFKNLISFDEIAESNPHFLDIDANPGWETVFGNNRPLKLEIGFGVGNFLIEMAIRYPENNFIGMDFYHKGIRKTISRMGKLQIQNIRIVYGDAREKIPILFHDGQLNNVYINFPDPWPKKRHIKRRLVKPHFVDLLTRKLEAGGAVHIATDCEPYAHEILDYFEAQPGLSNQIGRRGFMDQRVDVPRSKYEKNFINAGEKIYYLEYFKNTHVRSFTAEAG